MKEKKKRQSWMRVAASFTGGGGKRGTEGGDSREKGIAKGGGAIIGKFEMKNGSFSLGKFV